MFGLFVDVAFAIAVFLVAAAFVAAATAGAVGAPVFGAAAAFVAASAAVAFASSGFVVAAAFVAIIVDAVLASVLFVGFVSGVFTDITATVNDAFAMVLLLLLCFVVLQMTVSREGPPTFGGAKVHIQQESRRQSARGVASLRSVQFTEKPHKSARVRGCRSENCSLTLGTT